jgi:hypothetical protein
MGENGSHQGVRALSPDQSHEHFAELCALSTSETLTVEEWKELQEHLAGCAECRKTKRQYEAIVTHTIPDLAPDGEPAETGKGHDPLPPVSAEYALLQRLEAEEDADIVEPSAPPGPPLPIYIYRWGGWRRWGASAALLIATCAIGYWAGLHEGKWQDRGAQSAAVAKGDQSTPIHPRNRSTPLPTGSVNKPDNASALEAELRAVQLEAAKLREQKVQLETRLSQQGADLDRGAEERAELDKKLAATQTNLQSLENKLDLATQQNGQETAQFVEQQTHISELSASLRERDQKAAQDEQLLEHDRDIRNLMGARDLYIAEIYDIAKNGDTQKPFGRVFYTKGKSLVFYAYDLDQQAGVKRARTFQAWGRTGSDAKHDRNLGIFYQDDINKQRWILKSNDAKTLSQIDAVFVTVEPNGESAKPSGKPLLFTYLRMTPNHP